MQHISTEVTGTLPHGDTEHSTHHERINERQRTLFREALGRLADFSRSRAVPSPKSNGQPQRVDQELKLEAPAYLAYANRHSRVTHITFVRSLPHPFQNDSDDSKGSTLCGIRGVDVAPLATNAPLQDLTCGRCRRILQLSYGVS